MTLLDRLAAAFPDVDFDARTFVAWTDGPTEAEVREALAGVVNGEGVFERTLSDEFRRYCEHIIASLSGVPFSNSLYYDGGYSVAPGPKTRPGYGNEQVGQLAAFISRVRKPWCTCDVSVPEGQWHKPGCPARIKYDETQGRSAVEDGSGKVCACREPGCTRCV